MTSPPTIPTLHLIGRATAWPYAGYFLGALPADEHGAAVTWVGRIGDGQDLRESWRAALEVQQALSRRGPIEADRKRALSILWARLSGARGEALGADLRDRLVLLAIAVDQYGYAISAVGLRHLYLVSEGHLRPWVPAGHPLLGGSGLGAERPGALVGEGPLPALFASADADWLGLPEDLARLRSGVWP